ncbi:hypothetical protein LUZ61_007643 [Rhynchospora tenuis]|uniref:Aminotransferase class V domain-containing protein n=1 Tax=Rhynchospora tenuis TaxID=198213 RepID=A0AAD5ZTZ4_9POAL|nr:hypothetical protein LUZ61_007643 [Rhynchospora tenuis]
MPHLKRIIGVDQSHQTSPVMRPQKKSHDSDVFSSHHNNTVTRSKNMEDRISWLQSQLIGKSLDFETPFGKRYLTYADHTASGRSLKYIENYIIQEVLPFYGNTHTDDSYVGGNMTSIVQRASSYIKRCMGAGPDDVLLFCGSGSSGAIKRLQEVMGIAVPSILRDRVVKVLKEQERWVVFTGPYEHHSNLLSWRNSTAEVVEIGLDKNGLVDLEALKCQLVSPKYANRPMLGTFSACSNVTGIIVDTRAIARLLHEHGAFACFDFAASGPYVEIDMRSGDIEGYDAVFLSPHKFVGGPGTPGILLMNKSLYQLGSSAPSSCGGGTVAYVNNLDEKDTLYYDDIEEREDFGTPPIIQKVRAALAFWVKEYIGYDLIKLREHAFAKEAIEQLSMHSNIVILGNTQVDRLPIFSFLVYPGSDLNMDSSLSSEDYVMYDATSNKTKPLHGRFVAKLLCDLFGIQARGGCACAGPYGHYLLDVDKELSLCIRSAIMQGYNGIKPGWTRISFPYYMPREEYNFILSSIKFIATYGHRFLSLYSFDWITGNWTFRNRAFKHFFFEENHDRIKMQGLDMQNRQTVNGRSKTRDKLEMNERFQNYLESARKLAISLPESSTSCGVPDDLDPRLILFRI